MMNAEKTFKALVQMARAYKFKVSFFRGEPECDIDGSIYGLSIKINSNRSYETRLKTLIQLLSMYGFNGLNSGYATIQTGVKKGGLSGSIAAFTLNIVNAIQAR